MTWWKQTREDLATLAPVGLSFAILVTCGLTMAKLGWHLAGTSPAETGLFFGLILGPLVGPTLGRWKKGEQPVPREDQALYLEGKMKRYSLLFSVNGGAFAIGTLSKPRLHKGLGVAALSLGAIVFTVVMTADIWLWGARMRNEHGAMLFRPIGQSILLMIGTLLCAGWVLVGRSRG